jgi:hypothetical protein
VGSWTEERAAVRDVIAGSGAVKEGTAFAGLGGEGAGAGAGAGGTNDWTR